MLPPNFTLLQVTPELQSGGVEQTTLDIARAVVDAGGRALVATRGGRMVEQLTAVGGEFVQLPVHSKNPLVMARNAAALERLIRAEGVHLVHARSRAPAFSALAAARRTGVPFVATYHGVYNARSPWKRWYNAVMTRGDLVIANSGYTRAHVLAEHRVDPAKVIAIPRGVDLARFDPAAVSAERVASVRRAWGLTETDGPVFLLPGRLTRWKGQAFILSALTTPFPLDGGRWPREAGSDGGERRAASYCPEDREAASPPSPPSDPPPAGHLPPSRGKAVVIFAGDDQGRADHRAELQRLAAPFGDRARIVGHVADMPAAYLAADIVLAPSLEPEAFGRTAAEAQAMGRPILAAAHGGALEVVADGVTGRLIPPGDEAAWAAALDAAAAWPPERRAAMGAAGRERVRRLFSLERMQADTLAAYARVLEPRRR